MNGGNIWFLTSVISHLAAAVVLRQQSAVIPGEKNLYATSQNINVLHLKSDSPRVSINPSAWRALIGIGAHFPHSNLCLRSDPVFFLFFLPSPTLCDPDRRDPPYTMLWNSETRQAFGRFFFFFFWIQTLAVQQKKTLRIKKRTTKYFQIKLIVSWNVNSWANPPPPPILSIVTGRCSGSLCRRLDALSDGGFASSCSELNFFIGWEFFGGG